MNSAWLIFALIAAFLASASSLAEKKTLFRQHALEFSATMSIYTLLLTIPFWFIADFKSLTLEATGLIYIGSLLGALAFLLIAKAMRHIAISLIAPFLVFEPMFVAIFAVILLGEKIAAQQIIGIVVLIIGAYTLTSYHQDNLLDPFRNIFKSKYLKYIFIGLGLYALDSIIDKKVLGTPADGGLGVAVWTFMPLIHFFIALNFILLMIIFADGFEGIAKGFETGGKWVFAVAVLTIGYRLSQQYAISLPGVLISLVIPIKRLSSLFSTIIGGELFHEEHVLRKSIACIIMIIGAVLITLNL